MKSMKMFAALMLCLLAASACTPDHRYVTVEGMVWNTAYHITYCGPKELADSILPVLDRMSASVSVFEKTSLVNRVNAQERTLVDSIFKTVYTAAREVNAASHGAFDPTVGPLIEVWGFGKNREALPDTACIDTIMRHVGLAKTVLHGDTLVKASPDISFNFSAIAKGYGCDMVADMFRRNGVTDYLVEIGGEIAVSGMSPHGGDWRVSVDVPKADAQPGVASAATISITDCGLATSGNYRNYHKDKAGRTFGHTIDPVSGRPATTDVLSATVVARNTMLADAYATASMVMGSRRALAMADSLDLPMLLILSDNNIVISRKMKGLWKQ